MSNSVSVKSLNLPNNHYFFKVSQDVADICNFFFKRYLVNMFVYSRYFDNGECLVLTNGGNWLSHHLKMRYMFPAPFSSEILKKKEAYNFILSNGIFKKAKYDLLNLFNSDVGIDFVFKNENYYEICCFSFPPHIRDSINIFLNNIESFKKFIHFFKEKASKLISLGEKNMVDLPLDMRGIIQKPPSFRISNVSIPLTPREEDCLFYSLKGKTSKETAKILGISHRTVEDHVENLKKKYGFHYKREFFTIYDDLKLEINKNYLVSKNKIRSKNG